MSELLTLLKSRLDTEWMIGYDSNYFYHSTQSYIDQFTQLKSCHISPKIILVQQDNLEFLSAFLAGIITNCHLFLGNHHWKRQEWQQVINLIQPNEILGDSNLLKLSSNNNSKNNPLPPQHFIMIPTGGTSGDIRFAIHNWRTLSASVKGFTEFFEVEQVNSFCVLPLYHVSGLMQFMRSFLTQGKLNICPYYKLKTN
ncbi:MAG: hypothetical protein AAGF26_15480, partial [Cyanobacteria bacterium P01_G01_bin.49]